MALGRLFLIYIADLKTQGKDNRLIKFADDCTLLVPAGSNVSVECEMKSIMGNTKQNDVKSRKNKRNCPIAHILANFLCLRN